MPPRAAENDSPVESGEIVRLEYELWADSGDRSDLVDTTKEDVAQQASLRAPEGHVWGPRAHLVGGDYFPSGIESSLVGHSIGEEFEKEYTPSEAFGERDPKLIELYSMHEISRLPEMRRDDAHLDLGTILNIRGRQGRVVTLTAARVRVDFNPRFAGRKIRGKFKLVDRVAEPAEKVRALVELQYGRGKEFKIETHGETITLHVPERSKFDLAWFAAKPRVIDRIRTQLKPGSIRLVEEYATPTPAAEEKEPTAAKEPTESSGKKTKAAKAQPAEAGLSSS